MANNLQDLSYLVVSLAAAYLVHSTILLTAAWAATKALRIRSHALLELIWKAAAVLGLVTAPLQLMLGVSEPFIPERTASISVRGPSAAALCSG